MPEINLGSYLSESLPVKRDTIVITVGVTKRIKQIL